jgi:hypothetical protein
MISVRLRKLLIAKRAAGERMTPEETVAHRRWVVLAMSSVLPSEPRLTDSELFERAVALDHPFLRLSHTGYVRPRGIPGTGPQEALRWNELNYSDFCDWMREVQGDDRGDRT